MEDYGFDAWLEDLYEERYELPDYEQFEMRQLDLDRDYEGLYDGYYDDEPEVAWDDLEELRADEARHEDTPGDDDGTAGVPALV